jgi:methylmalonyl-CoA mutase N-terminal domain/subunit
VTAEKPGKFPYTRGLYKNMYKDKLWTMRQYAGYTTAEESNNRFKFLLENGVNGLSVAFDLPTQIGYDSDHSMAEGEVGKVGVPISYLKNMEDLFQDIPLDEVSTSMTINATAPVLLGFYISLAKKKNINIKKLHGTLQNDILKEYIARGTYIYPPKPSLKLVTDVFEFCSKNLPNWNTISISGYHIREAGSTAVQELGFTFSNAIAYVQSAIDKGLDPNVFGQRISFFLNAHNGFLEEISKFRAARNIWSKIMSERFGVTLEKALMFRFHTQTGGSTLTASDIDNNTVRTTIQALSAVLGGTQSLHTNSKDEALSLPSTKTARLALRTQQIIAHESGVAKYADPFGGSYLIEDMTDKYIKETFKIIENIDDLGGAVSAIENKYMEDAISSSAYEYQKKVENSENIIIGVNKYEDKNKNDPDLQKIDPKKVKDQIESLKRFKENRDNIQVIQKLKKLEESAKNDINVMPDIISCIENDCTLGEISDSIRNVFGEY